jgi:hypothetical protein
MAQELQQLEQPTQKRGCLGRLGCALGLIIWLAILTLPCMFFILSVQQEISVSLGSAPGQTLRAWVVMEEDRGIGVSVPTVYNTGDNNLCVQTDVRYFLWAGEGEDSVYCECYTRSADTWTSTTTTQGTCGNP